MTELPADASEAGEPDPANTYALRIEALRDGGAEQFDAVRFHHMARLQQRSKGLTAEARHRIESMLSSRLAEFERDFASQQTQASAWVAEIAKVLPEAGDELTHHFKQGNFGAIERRYRLHSRQHKSPLAELIQQLTAHAPAEQSSAKEPATVELKAIRYFRDDWSRLSAQRQLSDAIDQAPENAGPLNSHMLVLNSLTMMRTIAPDYLNRFMAYADALLWLDAAERPRGNPKSRARPVQS